MSGLWLLSYLVLWIVVIGSVCMLVGVLQQLGISQQRIRALEQASGIMDSQAPIVLPENDGPAIGTRMPDVTVETANGYGTIQLSARADTDTSGTWALQAL
jgi:hypothetical protein